MAQGTVDAIWEAFRDFFENESILKVWHNYSFDRHVLGNVWVGGKPIEARGFHADTMHMARLWDSSRRGKGYSLEALSGCVSAHVTPLHTLASALSLQAARESQKSNLQVPDSFEA